MHDTVLCFGVYLLCYLFKVTISWKCDNKFGGCMLGKGKKKTIEWLSGRKCKLRGNVIEMRRTAAWRAKEARNK